MPERRKKGRAQGSPSFDGALWTGSMWFRLKCGEGWRPRVARRMARPYAALNFLAVSRPPGWAAGGVSTDLCGHEARPPAGPAMRPFAVRPPPTPHPAFGEEVAEWWERKVNTQTKPAVFVGKLNTSRVLSKLRPAELLCVCVRACEERPGSRTQRHLPCDFSIHLKESRREGSKVAARPAVLKRWSSERRSPLGPPRRTVPTPVTPVCKTLKTVRKGR